MPFRQALAKAIKADTLSFVMFEIGLFGWMGFVAFVLISKLYPTSPVFWFVMQIGMILGFFTSYPANWWLVRKGIKHGM
jgi:apolipoprotein N-acyltransferase